MATATVADPRLPGALGSCVATLRRLANYELDPPIARRLEELFDRKEFLNEPEHEELMRLVDFVRKRSLEKLEAQVALKELGEIFPEAVNGH